MKVNITVLAKDAEQQKFILELSRKIEQETPGIKIHIATESKKLVPHEVLLIIAINIISQISSKILLRILDNLWKELTKKDLQVELSPLDKVQENAENYLRAKHLVDYEIVKKEDKGLYVYLVYKTFDSTHRFYISKSDLAIIRYEKESFK